MDMKTKVAPEKTEKGLLAKLNSKLLSSTTHEGAKSVSPATVLLKLSLRGFWELILILKTQLCRIVAERFLSFLISIQS